MNAIVVVESPAKAKTINKYLGNGFTVLASLGHVRDLPAKDGSVMPEQSFAMAWEADARGEKQVSAIAKALKSADTLYLATDPDREGEAISWHVRAMLEDRHALDGIKVRRITFNEITKSAIQAALKAPRDLDAALIEAYLARRALDYLVGFTLSPVLWRKLPGSRSAGRVQSVALRLICEREAEIEVFRPREYWTISAEFLTPNGASFAAKLTHRAGRKVEQFGIPSETAAMAAKAAVESGAFKIASVEKRRTRRHPLPPFTTSTLQQDASRKLGLSAQQTMRLAQQLYEGVDLDGETVGLITYMRTDGVQMAGEAISAARARIQSGFGEKYLPRSPRLYQSKAKNAQEAHEAIRPTDFGRIPDKVMRALNRDQARLYDLIYKRALASQMESAELDQTSVEISDSSGNVLRATGSVLAFDGFLRLYHEDVDDAGAEDAESRLLPPMASGDLLSTDTVAAEQHFTQPPPRYSEASLVKKMEELGIGRPSTYASILSVLRDRNYVRMDNRRFIPEDRGRLVTAFLVAFFGRYVDTGFTAALEEKLDEISAGSIDWRAVMRDFWADFFSAVEQTKDLKISDVIETLDAELGPHFFPPREDGTDPRVCQACGSGRLGLKLGRFGAFIGCSNYPECQYTRKLAIDGTNDVADTLRDGMRVLGKDPNGVPVTLRRGPYGLYVQLGDLDPDNKKFKPRRISLPRGMDGENLSLDRALGLLSLPRMIGVHPETKQDIHAGIGRFGPYVKMGSIFASLDQDDDLLTVGLNRAVAVLAKKQEGIRELGAHPADGIPILLRKGRFGPYVQHGDLVASLPRGTELKDVSLERAVALLNEKGKKLPKRGGKPKAKIASSKTISMPKTARPKVQPKRSATLGRKRPKAPSRPKK